MKKIFSVILTVLMAFGSVGCSAQQNVKAEDKPTDFGVKLNIDGEDKNLVAYNIEDNNYFKLRDVANVLKGTKAHFDVLWNDEKKAIELNSNADYSTNEEISKEMLANPTPTQRDVAIYMDNAKILMKAYEIAENNYFKLRDLASAVNFNVDWNEEKEVIEIDTSKGYEYPAETNGNFALNTKYPSFMGMTKAFIDDKCGNKGNYNGELGLSDYGNGLMVGYGVLGNFDAPKDTDRASTLYISFDNLFFNCPDTLTVDLIKSVFPETKNGYNEMDDENLLFADYCGVAIEFHTDLSMSKTSYAVIRSDSTFAEIEDYSKSNSDGDFVGYYQTDEWVSGSYVEVSKVGSEYFVNLLLVRAASVENEVANIVDSHKLVLNYSYDNLMLEWSDDYNNLNIQCSDRNWTNMATDEPIHFYRTR